MYDPETTDKECVGELVQRWHDDHYKTDSKQQRATELLSQAAVWLRDRPGQVATRAEMTAALRVSDRTLRDYLAMGESRGRGVGLGGGGGVGGQQCPLPCQS